MSKKSRKKSPKTAPTRKATAKSLKVSKTARTKPGRPTAKKSKTTQPRKTSHKAASKRLKTPSSAKAAKPRSQSPSVETTHSLSEGDKAPAFHLPRDGGGMVSLSDFAGKKLVLFFYPKADTPGCTKEAIDFTRLRADFAKAGTEVLGISADPQKNQERFRDKHRLAVPLISDEKHEMLEAYGAWGEKSMYGRTFLGIIRTTVLIGADGRIAQIWSRVKVEGHAEKVLQAAQEL